MKRLKGFTLAEVLVVLGIIGFVAAYTIPTLVGNYQKKVQVTQLHKVYNELSQALLKYQNDKNALSYREAGMSSEDKMISFIQQYFKVVQNCTTQGTPCMASNYKKLSGVSGYDASKSKNCFAIANGSVLCPRYSDNYMWFLVDTNGAKGPNIQGRDFFTMFVYKDGTIDDKLPEKSTTLPLTKEQREAQFTSACKGNSGNDLHGCFGKILNDGWEMNY